MLTISKTFARGALQVANHARRTISTSSVRPFFYRDPFPPLWLYDPFRQTSHPSPFRRRQMDPFALLDHFFDDNYTSGVRDNAAKMSISDKGDLIYQVDVSGYRPEELQVNMEGDNVVIQGEHKEEKEGESVHRKFVRKFRIPEGIQKNSLKCGIDPKGCLTVSAKKSAIEGGETRSIPIDVKTTEAKPIEDK